MLERGEQIELLVDKAEDLGDGAFEFKKRSTGLKRMMCMKNAKMTAICLIVLIAIILFIVGVSGGFNKPPEKR